MYVTTFDASYLHRGLVMVDTFIKCNPDRMLKVWCIDESSYKAVTTWKKNNQVDFKCEYLGDIQNKILWQLRDTRNYREFCWSLSSFLTNYELMQGEPQVTYLDADLYFTDTVSSIEEEISKSSIAAISHRFPENFDHYKVNGTFNVQWVTFKNDEDGQRCSKEWLDECIGSTEYEPEKGIVGDQKYLDMWPSRFASFHEIENSGAGVGPWNFSTHQCSLVNNKWIVNKKYPLVFYHFQGLKISKFGWVIPCGSEFMKSNHFPRHLYREYVSKLAKIQQELSTTEKPRRLFIMSGPGVAVSEIIIKFKNSYRNRIK